MSTKYNWPLIRERAAELTREEKPESWTELADLLGIPRKTLVEGLEREFAITEFEQVAAESDLTWDGSLIRRFEKRIKPIKFPQEVIVMPKFPHCQNAGVFLLGDLHYGAKFDGGPLFPGYSSDLARQYLANYFRWIYHQAFTLNLKEIHIMLLGDLIDGTHLRVQHARETDLHLVDQIMDVVTLLAQELARLRILLPGVTIKVYGVPGNHARVQAKVGAGHLAENMDLLIARFLAKYLENAEIEFLIADEWYVVGEVLGHGFVLVHGDEVRGFANAPKKMLQRLSQYRALNRMAGLQEDIQYVFCGHFHVRGFAEEMDMQVHINGSFQPSSEFIGHRIGKASRPTQEAILFNKEVGAYGKLTCFLDVPPPSVDGQDLVA